MQGSNPHLLHDMQILYHPSQQGSPYWITLIKQKSLRTICLVLLEVRGGSLVFGTGFALDCSFVTSNHFGLP